MYLEISWVLNLTSTPLLNFNILDNAQIDVNDFIKKVNIKSAPKKITRSTSCVMLKYVERTSRIGCVMLDWLKVTPTKKPRNPMLVSSINAITIKSIRSK